MSADNPNPRKGIDRDAPTTVDERREQIVRGRLETPTDTLRDVQLGETDNVADALDDAITELQALRAMLPEGCEE